MPFSKSIFLFILAFYCHSNLVYSQSKQHVLTKKYSPKQLKEDAEIFKTVTLRMHPVIGVYKPKAHYITLFDKFIESLTDSLTEREFRIKTRFIIHELECGHTTSRFSKAYDKATNYKKIKQSPYLFTAVDSKIYVLGSISKKQDSVLKKGTEITQLNGISSDSILNYLNVIMPSDGLNKTSDGHTQQTLLTNFFPLLFGFTDSIHVHYKNKHDIQKFAYATEIIKNSKPIAFGPKPDSLLISYKRAKMKYRFLDSEKKTMFLKIDAFSASRSKKAYRKLFSKLAKHQSENLIIDLRNNGGGSMNNAKTLLSYLIKDTKSLTLKTTITSFPLKKYTHGNTVFKVILSVFKLAGKKTSHHDTDDYKFIIKPKLKNHFDKNILVLFNGGSFSASCLVSAYLKSNGNTIFIGEETGGTIEGCNAGIMPNYKLPNTQIKIRMPAFRVIHDVNPTLTRHGILPDYETHYTLDDLFSRKDLELSKAMEVIHTKK